MAKYLVTGGAGFIGSHLVTKLVEFGETVCVLDDLSSGRVENLAHLSPTRIQFVEGSVTDRQKLDQAVRGVDVVFHHAALASVPRSVTDPLETHAADATGTVTLLEAARQAGVRRVVYAASSSCYGNRPEMPKAESHLPQVLSPYAAAKLAGELYCEAFAACYPLETVRLRYFNVFGPRQDPQGTLRGRDPALCDGPFGRAPSDDFRRRIAITRFYLRRQRRRCESPGRFGRGNLGPSLQRCLRPFDERA